MKPLQKAFHAGANGDVLQAAGLPHKLQKQGNILGLGFDDGYVRGLAGGRFFACEQQERQAGNQTNGFKSHGFSAACEQ
jgi:hypothetical protein